jgi:AcrR family transcriptional regulator
MVDLSRESGLSRGTVYRYFATKEELLARLEQHLEESFESSIDAAVANQPDLDNRVAVVTEAVFGFLGRSEFGQILEIDPGFFRAFFEAHFDTFVAAVADALGPAAVSEHAAVPPLDTRIVAEVLFRLGLSFQLVPPESGQVTVDALHRTVDRMLGRTKRTAVLAQPASAGVALAGRCAPHATVHFQRAPEQPRVPAGNAGQPVR